MNSISALKFSKMYGILKLPGLAKFYLNMENQQAKN